MHVLYRHSPLGLSSSSMVINFFVCFFTHHCLKRNWQPNSSSDLSLCRDRSLEQILPFVMNILYGVELIVHNLLGFRITLQFLGSFEVFPWATKSQRQLAEMELCPQLQPNSGCNLLSCWHSSSRGTETQDNSDVVTTVMLWQGQIYSFHTLSQHLLSGLTLCPGLLASQIKKKDRHVSCNCNLSG